MAARDRSADTRPALDLARELQTVADDEGMGGPKAPPPLPLDDPTTIFDVIVTEQEVRDTTHQLFVDGHYALAVEEAFKCVNNSSSAGRTARPMVRA